jgi:hypothetical protein
VWVDVCAIAGFFWMAFFKCHSAEHPVKNIIMAIILVVFVNKSHLTALTIFNCVM